MPHSSNPVSIRIGIHTGPCVSGLIGTKLPKWTVLGGTINTAARAEQTCRPDHVQVTEATHKLLPPGKK
ncbi:guanylyl and adenylyl cyclase family member, partial [Dunaliella salina]